MLIIRTAGLSAGLAPVAECVSEALATKWNFQSGEEKGTPDPELGDSTWQTPDVPHDWSIDGNSSTGNPIKCGWLASGIGYLVLDYR